MRVCIVTQSEAFAASAGMRIRYDRLRDAASSMGVEVSAIPIDGLLARKDFVHDVYIFAKTYSAHSYLIAHRMRQMGKLVGIDIFDDYFTQTSDTRHRFHRVWLATMGEIVNFVLCSTPRLEAALRLLLPGKPVLVIPDPYDVFDQAGVEELLTAKIADAQSGRVLRVLWFGIGDNPFFPVGIRDLVAFGGELAGFSRSGWSAQLTVLTNIRALSAEGLNYLRRLPIPFTIEEWTPEGEQGALVRSHVCFLPVNGQRFSRMKSLNRAITAFVQGCQVLCRGYPLYEALSAFSYASASPMLTDFETGYPALRPDTLAALGRALTELADPYKSAEGLVSFLREAQPAPLIAKPTPTESFEPGRRSARLAVRGFLGGFAADIGIVHGARGEKEIDALVKRLGGLSVKSPLCRSNGNFDVRFEVSKTGSMKVFIGELVRELVAEIFRQSLVHSGDGFYLLPEDVTRERLRFANLRLLPQPLSIKDVAAAPRLMADVLDACRHLFPDVRFYVSERSPLLAQRPEIAA